METDKCCDNCKYCLYICEGDYVCEAEVDQGITTLNPIKEDHAPADHYFWCGGKHWRKR